MQKQNCKLIRILLKPLLWVFTGFIILIFVQRVSAQSQISGQLNVDSTWSRVVYLSLIPNFDQLYSMSSQMIIESSELDNAGNFSFKTNYLPPENYFYRVHLTKKGDSPASLIIGGKDENHLFFISNNKSDILIKSNTRNSLFGNVKMEGFTPAKMVSEINKMVCFVDTANFNSSSLKRELMEDALDEKLRSIADTCSFPLVALYAIYKSHFEINIEKNRSYYTRFIEKWSVEDSSYFTEFKKKIPAEQKQRNYSFLFAVAGLFIGVILTLLFLKRKQKSTNLLQDLTIQERKVFALLQNSKSNKEISDELNVSLSTVKSHVNSIFSKLNIKSRKELVN